MAPLSFPSDADGLPLSVGVHVEYRRDDVIVGTGRILGLTSAHATILTHRERIVQPRMNTIHVSFLVGHVCEFLYPGSGILRGRIRSIENDVALIAVNDASNSFVYVHKARLTVDPPVCQECEWPFCQGHETPARD
jgi:hypothetical protein